MSELIESRLAWMLGGITLLGLAAGYLAARSPRLALARGIGAALPAGATCGLLALAAEGSLPIEAATLSDTYASTLFVVVAALGAVGVAHAALGDRRAAVAGTVVAGTVTAVLAGIDVDAVAQAGMALAAGLAIELVAVRAILVPCLERALPTRLPDRFRR